MRYAAIASDAVGFSMGSSVFSVVTGAWVVVVPSGFAVVVVPVVVVLPV